MGVRENLVVVGKVQTYRTLFHIVLRRLFSLDRRDSAIISLLVIGDHLHKVVATRDIDYNNVARRPRDHAII
jgi:hypothetical protein